MQQASPTLRFAGGQAGSAYPFPAAAGLDWRAAETPDCYQASVSLNNLQPGELLVPSLSLVTDKHYGVRCSLTAGEEQWSLAAVASDPALKQLLQTDELSQSAARPAGHPDAVTTHIDLFAIHQPLPSAKLDITLCAPGLDWQTLAAQSADYLVVVSRRMAEQRASVPRSPRPSGDVPAISQMRQPSRQRSGTCSPTCVSMLMAAHGTPYHPAFVDACKDLSSGMFGVWPLNIFQASRRGFVGAVELISSWEQIATCPDPFVASIRFGEQGLTGSPLKRTGGHLVVVRGTTARNVLCNDPAADTAAEVAREYDLEEFTQAWLKHRGAAYFLYPLVSQR